METIASFTVDHLRLQPGLYTSRKDRSAGVTATTFDLRFTRPNREPVMDMPAVHTIEHLGATFLRNSSRSSEVIYFGPMGCRTGFYLVMFGDLSPEDVYPLVREMCLFILDFEGDIPGAAPEQCGNWSEQSLPMAKYYTEKYLKTLEEEKNFSYPGQEG